VLVSRHRRRIRGIPQMHEELVSLSVAAGSCVFRRKPAGDSDPFQPVIPTEASH